MADESELKTLFEEIDTTAEEMDRYRARLADKLENDVPARWRWRRIAILVPVAAAILAWLLYVPATPDLEQKSLSDLESLADSTTGHDALDAILHKAVTSPDDIVRLNGNMLLCLTRPDGSALREAASGVLSDPRPEFRARYLEYLLDFADSYELDADRIEDQMEVETDPICLSLYTQLLDLAEAGTRVIV